MFRPTIKVWSKSILQIESLMKWRGHMLSAAGVRLFHAPTARLDRNRDSSFDDDDTKGKAESDLRRAAKAAAKSFGPNWEPIRDDLLSRLKRTETNDGRKEEPTKRADGEEKLETAEASPVSRQISLKNTLRSMRVRQPFADSGASSEKVLISFTAKKVKEGEAIEQPKKDIWWERHQAMMQKFGGSLPKSEFDEMIELTKAGKMFTFPIDNEEDMIEEKKYKFQEHIFLERYLTEFPKKGPLRTFIDLVCLGLSMNYWHSVPEKIEIIQWYADYFRDKQKTLQKSLPPDEMMKPPVRQQLEQSQ